MWALLREPRAADDANRRVHLEKPRKTDGPALFVVTLAWLTAIRETSGHQRVTRLEGQRPRRHNHESHSHNKFRNHCHHRVGV